MHQTVRCRKLSLVSLLMLVCFSSYAVFHGLLRKNTISRHFHHAAQRGTIENMHPNDVTESQEYDTESLCPSTRGSTDARGAAGGRGNSNSKTIQAGFLPHCTKKSITFRGQSGFDRGIYKRFYNQPPQCHGVIVEMGALDGLKYSNSWGFENCLDWTAIHIEGSNTNYQKLVTNRPRSINIHAAACSGISVVFSEANSPEASGVQADMPDSHRKRWIKKNDVNVTVPCRKLSEIFLEHRVKEIDVFFLDVEGAELQALKTLDFTKVRITTFVVEMDGQNETKDAGVRNILYENGYTRVSEFTVPCHTKKTKYCEPNEVFRHTSG
eukprot:m.8383 g.8383  ORF g.8383 m.8383 type:complete len:325 (+) comp6305_c0_seq1:220-1194(+)